MRKLIPLASVLLALAAFAGGRVLPAHAANLPATCATLQTELNAASAGDTVTLANGGTPCTSPTITYPVTLPNLAITLTGAQTGDGFNAAGAAQILTGTNVGATTISNLLFENGNAGDSYGGAIYVNPSGGAADPTISNDTFLGNTASGTGAVDLGGSGGTITISGDTFGGTAAGDPNTSTSYGDAGGVYIDATSEIVISNNKFIDNTSNGGNNGGGSAGAIFAISRASDATITFTGNTLSGNKETAGGGIGGGASLQGLNLTVTGNTFEDNSIGSGSGGLGNYGGGLDIVGTGTGATVTQADNQFIDNSVGSWSYGEDAVYYGGGGEFVQADTITSVDDTFTGNQVGSGNEDTWPAGGAIGIQGLSSGETSKLTAENLVATNNTAAGEYAYGGGIYAGYNAGCSSACPAEVDLYDSTIDHNTAANGSGMSGGVTGDIGKATNSIVYGNLGAPSQLNFGNLTVAYSDSCGRGGSVFSGAGNVCVDPALVNPAGNDIDETASSLTVNKGSNALVPAALTKDYKGDPRISGGTVDMGADEYQAAASAPAGTSTVTPTPSVGAASATIPAGIGLGTVGAALLLLTARVRRRRRPS